MFFLLSDKAAVHQIHPWFWVLLVDYTINLIVLNSFKVDCSKRFPLVL